MKTNIDIIDYSFQSADKIELSDRFKLPLGKLSKEIHSALEKIKTENKNYQNLDPTVLLSIYLGRKLLDKNSFLECSEIGVNVGSSRGATSVFEKEHGKFVNGNEMSLLTSPLTTLGNVSTWLAQDLKLSGVHFSHSITCSTAMHSILNAISWLEAGFSESFLAGGVEMPITPFTLEQMKILKIYSSETESPFCKPFEENKTKSSFVLAEGGGLFLLKKHSENNLRKGKITGIGYHTEQIRHATSVKSNGEGFFESMKKALNGKDLSTVDLVIAHAPGTKRGDEAELKAVKRLFGENHPYTTSTKFLTGHSFGASGALSLSAALEILDSNDSFEKWILPYKSLNSSNSPKKIERILVNSAGFGGNIVSVLVER